MNIFSSSWYIFHLFGKRPFLIKSTVFPNGGSIYIYIWILCVYIDIYLCTCCSLTSPGNGHCPLPNSFDNVTYLAIMFCFFTMAKVKLSFYLFAWFVSTYLISLNDCLSKRPCGISDIRQNWDERRHSFWLSALLNW